MADSEYREIQFSDKDIVNPDDWIPAGEYDPHNVRPWLFHDHGFILCVVFADSLQDAEDIAADSGKIDHFKIDMKGSERDDYLTPNFSESISGKETADCEYIDKEGVKYWWRKGSNPAFLGDSGEPYDIELLYVVELPNPPASFCAQFNSM